MTSGSPGGTPGLGFSMGNGGGGGGNLCSGGASSRGAIYIYY
jgi:hypothetical protein